MNYEDRRAVLVSYRLQQAQEALAVRTHLGV